MTSVACTEKVKNISLIACGTVECTFLHIVLIQKRKIRKLEYSRSLPLFIIKNGRKIKINKYHTPNDWEQLFIKFDNIPFDRFLKTI